MSKSKVQEDAEFFGGLLKLAVAGVVLFVAWHILKAVFFIIASILFLTVFYVLPVVVVATGVGFLMAMVSRWVAGRGTYEPQVDMRWSVAFFAAICGITWLTLGAPHSHKVISDDLKKEKWALVEWPDLFLQYDKIAEKIGLIELKQRPAMQVKEFTEAGFEFIAEPPKVKVGSKKRKSSEPAIYGPPLPPGFSVDAFGEVSAHHSELLVRLNGDDSFPLYDLPNLVRLIWLGLIVGSPIVFLLFAMVIINEEEKRIRAEIKALKTQYDESKSVLKSDLTAKIGILQNQVNARDTTIKGLKERVELLVKTTADGGKPSLATGLTVGSPVSEPQKAPGALGSEFL